MKRNRRGAIAALWAAAILLRALPLAGAAAAPPIPCDYYDKASFERSVDQARAYPLEGTLRAGVMPHHLLAGSMIASFFATAAQSGQEIETVLFVAPSHYPKDGRAVTARGGWQTPYGVAENDSAVTGRLLDNAYIGARVDEENLRLDHAVSGLASYAKYYLPQAEISAILLPNRLDYAHVDALAEEILRIAKAKNILVVCSVDFSHYLAPDEAALRDGETRRALETFDWDAVRRFRDDHMDSPQAVTTFLRYLEGCGIGEVTFFDHAGADDFLRLPGTHPVYRDGTTTYFVLGGVAR